MTRVEIDPRGTPASVNRVIPCQAPYTPYSILSHEPPSSHGPDAQFRLPPRYAAAVIPQLVGGSASMPPGAPHRTKGRGEWFHHTRRTQYCCMLCNSGGIVCQHRGTRRATAGNTQHLRPTPIEYGLHRSADWVALSRNEPAPLVVERRPRRRACLHPTSHLPWCTPSCHTRPKYGKLQYTAHLQHYFPTALFEALLICSFTILAVSISSRSSHRPRKPLPGRRPILAGVPGKFPAIDLQQSRIFTWHTYT